MTDWNNPATIAQAFYAATALMWLCIGIYAYDTLQYLTFDLAIIFGKRQRRWPQLPYIFSKICMWTYLLTNMICFLTNTEINCNGTVKAIEMQMGWIAVSSSMLLAFRAVCVYTGKTRTVVSVVLTIMTLGLLAAWMEGVKDLDAAWVLGAGNPWQSGACVFTRLSTQYAIKYVVTIVFDLIVMILTVVGVVRMNTGSRIGTILVKQGIQYFLFTFMINALVAGLTLANLNPVMSLIGAIPSATVCVMCSTRLYVHLAEEAKPKPEGVNSSQLSSTFSGEKLARFFKRSTGTGGNTSRLQPSFASRSGVSSKDSTAVGGGVGSLSYTVRNGSHSPVDVKSFSNDDLEAGGRSHGIVSITEERTVVQEPMPEHLAGTFDGSRTSDRPYGLDSVQSQFPKLSKS